MLSVAVVFTAPPLPTLNSTGADIVAYYTDHQYGFLVGNYLGAVAVLPAIIVIVYLTMLVRDAEPGRGWIWLVIAISTASGFGEAFVLFAALQAAAAVSPHATPQTAKALSDLANIVFAFFFVPNVAIVGSLAWGFLATRTMPAWTGWAGLTVSAIQLLGSLGTIVITGPMAAGGILTVATLGAFLAWLLAISVVLLLRPAKAAS
jgi:hypothetical protein